MPSPWVPTTLDQSTWGRERVLIDGVDLTFLRGVRTIVEDWSHADPFGPLDANIYFPQATGHEVVGAGDLAPIRTGHSVEIQKIRPDGTIDPQDCFQGFIDSLAEGRSETQYWIKAACRGFIYQADLSVQRPDEAFANSEDEDTITSAVAEALASVIGRRYYWPETVGGPSDRTTRKQGSLSQTTLNFVSELLAESWDTDGNKWTCLDKPRVNRRPQLVKVDRTTEHYTISFGARGLSFDPQRDLTGGANVIFGSGITPDGGAWSNYYLPDYHPDTTPVFPLDPGDDFTPGGSDTGFQVFSDKMRESGYRGMTSQDTYLSGDEDDVKSFQNRAAITVDGIVGRQTWDALFEPGSNSGTLSNGIFLPLAADLRTQPYLYNGRGQVIGDNPDYDPTFMRTEKWINYGADTTKGAATYSARAEMSFVHDGGFYGEMTLRTNPEECHRFDMRAGRNIRVKHFQGTEGMLFHITMVRVNRVDGSVALTVDSRARDYMTVTAIVQDEKESQTSVARGILQRPRSSTTALDTHVVFDAESPAGIVPRHQVQGGFWTVIPILFGQWGQIVQTLYAASPATEFWVGVFSKRVTANQLLAWVGDPSTSSKPWDTSYDALFDAGLLQAYGTSDAPCGYFPLTKGDDGASLTGRWEDDLSWDWASADVPRLWIAEYAADDTYLSGNFRNAPVQT